MPVYRVVVSRDCVLTQSGTVEIEARDLLEAEEKALEISQDSISWEDTDFATRDSTTYVADPDSIYRVRDA